MKRPRSTYIFLIQTGMCTLFFIPIDLYRPSICICMYVCLYIRVCVWEREKLLMKRLSTIHYQFAFPSSSFIDHSYESFSFLFISHIHSSLHKLNKSDRHAMSAVVVVSMNVFFSYFLLIKKKQRYLSFILSSAFCLSLCMILPSTSTVGYMCVYYNKEFVYTYSFYTRYLCVYFTRLYIINWWKRNEKNNPFLFVSSQLTYKRS
jgi:hypothetical protein